MAMHKSTKAKVIQLYSQGFSIRQIAEITGIKKSTVHRIIKG
jgi:transposase-like protein